MINFYLIHSSANNLCSGQPGPVTISRKILAFFFNVLITMLLFPLRILAFLLFPQISCLTEVGLLFPACLHYFSCVLALTAYCFIFCLCPSFISPNRREVLLKKESVAYVSFNSHAT